jgi:hypothetical protein
VNWITSLRISSEQVGSVDQGGQIGNGLAAFGLVMATGRAGNTKSGNMMGQSLQTWRSGSEQRAWLSALIATFEEISRPEVRAVPYDSHVLAALRAQLMRPASAFLPYASAYSLRN